MVDYHCGERRGGIEEAAVDDQDADVFGADAALLKELVKRCKHCGRGFCSAFLHCGRAAGSEDGFRDVGLVTDARRGEDSALEGEAVLVEFA